ncbi:MAG: metal-dependent hydrolase [Campylobacterota bacterium]|nr:metal-dependent hydrolase [Campylobacterota bacterium]
MASFEQHVNFAVVATGVIITPLHVAGILSVNESIVALFLGIFGGILPDLDSDTSKPLKIAFKMLSIFLPLLILLTISTKMSIVYMALLWGLSSTILQVVVFEIFTLTTKHRGVIHSIPMAIVVGLLSTNIFYYGLHVDKSFSTVAGFFIFYGFIIHLILDEIFSVNAFGMRMKKSFGTAFKLYDKSNMFGTAIAYGAVVLLFIVTPLQLDIVKNIFTSLSSIHLF